ncbi:MAG TPA: phenylalanine--tRNA ligase subunit beta, partial [Archangium sp.]
ILTSLGFKDLGQGAWEVPMARVDVGIEEDLIEEIARVRGFEAIPAALPRGLSALEPERPWVAAERRMRSALAGQGFDEVVNYSFVAPSELAAFQAEQGAIAVANPLSVEQSVMRTTLFASLVPNVTRSARFQAQGVRFYELARSYRGHEGGGVKGKPAASEVLELAGALWGLRDGARSWTGKDAVVDFYDARAAVDAVLESLHITGARYEPLESPWYHPRAAATVKLGDRVLGTVGELHPRAQKRLDAPAGIFLFQLDAHALLAAATLVTQATALSKFPSVLRDLAVVVPSEMPAEKVQAVILEVGQPLVDQARVFDVYEGKQVGEGKKNLAFALRYRSPDRTLTDTEVTDAHAKIVAEVTQRLGGALRA